MVAVLGVDVGTVRVGCAVADDQIQIPFPVAIWDKAQGAAERELLRTIQERGASTVVVGLPLGMNGQETEMCGVARSFVRRLQKRCQVTVYYVDESFSSDEARETMGTKGPLDSSAACLILDRYFKSGPLSTTS